MKSLHILTTVVLFLLITACSKDDYGLAKKNIPNWLKDQIKEDEKTIASDPSLMPNYGAWLSYQFNGKTYFEYDNPLSSLSRNPYSWEGVRVDISQPPFTSYWNDKCCEQYVWKAPKYKRFE
ncbi:hypothetical protein GXP67_30765 [Rhodocytophaga rosea]|uniref:Lipoprotein n=1 Tax=Rhodocytophaga rosea TaxID=2704465 RepID=A0A6C0GRL3_9BACT|nr:hypothetical protein [Rhodocytophaga rosea]QHT70721.1 hypothetical protein GXP67_30765 [Rhodocytophaga rosea]